MTRGKGLYDDDGSGAESSAEQAKDPDTETPDVDKDSSEPTG
jgi:hypothetical protein